MAGPLKNERRELYAQELVKGTPQLEAFLKAGYARDKTAASKMAALPDVKARVAELQAKAATRAEVTVADIARQLDEDREFARSKDAPSAAVSATMGKAKVLGLVVDRHAGPTGGAIPIRFDLTGLSDEELDQLERIRTRIAVAGGDQGGEGQAGG